MGPENSVLIVCYTYPPMPGVGGRRWAKYTKYLIKSGWKVWVVSGTPQKESFSPWEDDIKGAIQIQLSNKYPKILNSPPASVWEKLKYRLALFYVKAISSVNYYDRGIRWEKQFVKTVSDILFKNNIPNLIVSGAPFSLLYYGTKLKNKFPKLNFIADIRDPWTDANYYGFGNLSNTRQTNEFQRLEAVLNGADSLLVPNESMKVKYEKLLGKTLDKMQIFEHAVDADTILPRKKDAMDLKEIELVALGSLYTGQENVMRQMARALNKANTVTRISFYTAEKKYEEIFAGENTNADCVHYYPIVKQSEVAEILSACTAVLFFVPENIKNVLATKFIEVIAARVPIVAIGCRGGVSKYLEENRLGIFIEQNEIEEKFPNLGKLISELNYNDTFDYSDQTFEKQCQRLEEILIHK